MKIKYISLILFVFSFINNISAQITIVGSHVTIPNGTTVTGVELRDAVRNSSSGKVEGRTITFYGVLTVNGTLTDHDAVYVFHSRSSGQKSRLDWNSTGVINFTDLTIHYTEDRGENISLGNGYNFDSRYTANWTRVKFIQGTHGRSDFFNNGNYHFNFKDVTLVSYGNGDYLHFQSNDTLRDIKIIGATSTLNFEPGGRGSSDKEVIINLKLRNVSKIVAALEGIGQLRIENLDWNINNWRFDERKLTKIEIVNPIKPSGWSSYTGASSKVREYYTHNLRVLDENRSPLSGVKVNLVYRNGDSQEYNKTSSANGTISEYEVLKRSNNTIRDEWNLTVFDYHYKYYNQKRTFQNKIDEDVLLFNDIGITQKNVELVKLYSEIDSASQLYDLAKYHKVKDENSIKRPAYDKEIIKYEDGDLIVDDNYSLILDPNHSQAMTVGTNTIRINVEKLEPNEKFYKLVVPGGITFLNGAWINFPHMYGSTNRYVRLKDVMSTDTVYVREKGSNTILGKYIGECGFSFEYDPVEELEFEMRTETGDKVLTYYSKNQSDFYNEFRIGVDESFLMEHMFLPTDRDRLFSIVDSVRIKLEDKTGILHQLLDSIKVMNTNVNRKVNDVLKD